LSGVWPKGTTGCRLDSGSEPPVPFEKLCVDALHDQSPLLNALELLLELPLLPFVMKTTSVSRRLTVGALFFEARTFCPSVSVKRTRKLPASPG